MGEPQGVFGISHRDCLHVGGEVPYRGRVYEIYKILDPRTFDEDGSPLTYYTLLKEKEE